MRINHRKCYNAFINATQNDNRIQFSDEFNKRERESIIIQFTNDNISFQDAKNNLAKVIPVAGS